MLRCETPSEGGAVITAYDLVFALFCNMCSFAWFALFCDPCGKGKLSDRQAEPRVVGASKRVFVYGTWRRRRVV